MYMDNQIPTLSNIQILTHGHAWNNNMGFMLSCLASKNMKNIL
jgi:hypothetical protein